MAHPHGLSTDGQELGGLWNGGLPVPDRTIARARVFLGSRPVFRAGPCLNLNTQFRGPKRVILRGLVHVDAH